MPAPFVIADRGRRHRRRASADRSRPIFVVPLVLGLGILLVLAGGCRVVEETAKLPMAAVTGTRPTGPDPAALQAALQRFSDEFSSRTVVALDEYARLVDTTAGRRQALTWKLSIGSAAIGIVSGANPTANLVDFLALTTVTHSLLEELRRREPDGPAFQMWLETSRNLEATAWKMAERVLSADHQRELREGIRRWWDENAGTRGAFFARPQELSSLVRQSGEKAERPGSVFALVGLDPTAGLDPAVREVTQTRLFAERALYATQRLPYLVRWHTELLTEDLLAAPQMTRVVSSAERLSESAVSVSRTVAELPDRLTAERQAMVEELNTQEGRLRDLSAEVGRTLAAGERMSTSLNTTLVTFDALMKRFGVGEPKKPSSGATNRPPFNILDYARTAEQLAVTAKELDVLFKDATATVDSPALDRRLKDVEAAATRVTRDTRSLLNHAFLLAAGLVLLTFGCALTYRRLLRRDAAASSATRS